MWQANDQGKPIGQSDIDNYIEKNDSGNQADLEKIKQAFQLIYNHYVEEVDQNTLTEGAIQGMLSVLKDPYSVYMDKKKAEQFNDSLDSSFEGIGAEISKIDGKIIIVSPFKNSPAEKAGLKPYDQIIKVDGKDVTNDDLYDVTLKIRGKKGTYVTLEILREGINKPIKIEVKRDTIPIETVYSNIEQVENYKIGYIEITSFSKDTGKDFAKQLKQLEKEKITGLIIDVRGNPGGFLSSVQEIASQLVTAKKPYVQIEERNGDREQFYSKLQEKKNYPIVVLTDQGSASASEILAAALKEGEGYPTIGERTFGKGTVQQQISLRDGSHIKLTLYKWLTPNGEWIHGKGIEPNIEVTQPELFQRQPINIETMLKREMNNEQVKNVQILLKSLGYEPGRMDGYYNQSTETAVKVFQEENRLPVTGVIDQKTAEALEKKALHETEKKENDRQLQMALKYLQYILTK